MMDKHNDMTTREMGGGGAYKVLLEEKIKYLIIMTACTAKNIP